MTERLKVPTGVATGRLDVYLAAKLKLSRSAAAGLIKAGRIAVNSEPARSSLNLTGGEEISITLAEVATSSPQAPDLPIVYEDDDLLVVDKPAGLTVHSGNGLGSVPTVADFARNHSTDPDPDRPGIVHRLDRDTSGLLVIAKTAAAKQALQKSWKDRAVEKSYLALTIGRLEPPEAVITLPLDRDPGQPTRRAVKAGGRPAVTRYHTLAAYPGYTYVQAQPETGRTHQLRVHFAALGHPIAGDVTYGSPRRPLGLPRQFLHATALKFTGPSGQVVDLKSPLPPDLGAILNQLTGPV